MCLTDRHTQVKEQERGEINPSDVHLQEKQNPFPSDDWCVRVSPEGGFPSSISPRFATRQTLDRFARSITRLPILSIYVLSRLLFAFVSTRGSSS